MNDKGAVSVLLSLDAANHNVSEGNFLEGNTSGLLNTIMSKGLPPVKAIKGD